MAAVAGSLHLLDGLGLWAEVRSPPLRQSGSMLLLDRDGVLNADVGYVGRPDQVVVLPGVAEAIAACNVAAIPVVVVSNQSGIARGLFGWDGFQAVQEVIDAALAGKGAHLDAVFACGYHAVGTGALAVADHPWRKPRPGMLTAALAILNGSGPRSGMVGDKASDMQAAAAADVALRFYVGYGDDAIMPMSCDIVASAAEAIDAFLGSVASASRDGALPRSARDTEGSLP